MYWLSKQGMQYLKDNLLQCRKKIIYIYIYIYIYMYMRYYIYKYIHNILFFNILEYMYALECI